MALDVFWSEETSQTPAHRWSRHHYFNSTALLWLLLVCPSTAKLMRIVVFDARMFVVSGALRTEAKNTSITSVQRTRAAVAWASEKPLLTLFALFATLPLFSLFLHVLKCSTFYDLCGTSKAAMNRFHHFIRVVSPRKFMCSSIEIFDANPLKCAGME